MMRRMFKKSKKDPAPHVGTTGFESQRGAPQTPSRLPESTQNATSTFIPTTSTPVETSQGSGSNPTTPSSASPTVPPPTLPLIEDILRSGGDDRAQNGDYNGAVVMYDEALRYAPTDSNLLLSRSFAHTMTTPPRLELALEDADAAIQYAPIDWQAWLQKGETRLKMGDLPGAEEALVNAVGFAQGTNKLTAQRSLGNVRARRATPLPSVEQPSSPSQFTYSVPLLSTPSAPSPPSTPTTRPSPINPMVTLTKPTSGASSTTNPTNSTPQVTPPLTSIPQPPNAPSAPRIRPASTTQAPRNLTPSIARKASSSTAPASPALQASSATCPSIPTPQVTPPAPSVLRPPRAQSPLKIGPATTSQVASNPTPNIARTASNSTSLAASSAQPTSANTSARTLSQKSHHVWETLYPNSSSSTQVTSGTGASSTSPSPNTPATDPFRTTLSSSPRPTATTATTQQTPTANMQPTTRPISQNAGVWDFSSLPTEPTAATTTTAASSRSQTTSRPTPSSTRPAPNSTAETASGSEASSMTTPSVPNPTNQAAYSSNTTSQPSRSAPVTRAHNSSTVCQTPANAANLLDPLMNGLFGDPADAPPGYTPSLNNANPQIRALSQQALQTQLTELENKLKTSNKGALSLRPYTAAANIDCVRLFYLGMTQLELTARELSAPVYLHPTFNYMHLAPTSYPGNTWLDMDAETSAYYEGKLLGTVSISGYSEEYREHQLLIAPMLQLSLESTSTLPVIPLDKIVQRIQTLKISPTSEDNEGLRGLIGLSQLAALQSGFQSNRQRQIEIVCMGLNRSLYDAPTRFVDFSKARNISNNTFGTIGQGISLHHFLYQILLGAELLVRLRKEPITTSYTSLITNPISALIVLSSLWMENVTISATPAATTSITYPAPAPRYTLYALQSQQQIQGLIRFAEALSWPLMDEARAYIESSYRTLIANPTSVGFDICDWLFGLVLPGKIFRHRMMSCLVYASPSIRSISSAPYWDNGLVVKNKSYWPKRTVLGRVLGGLRNPKSVCGWVGPVPAPEGWTATGWIRLNSRRVDIPIPISSTGQNTLESLGFESSEGVEDPEALVHSIVDSNEWIPSPGPPPRSRSDTSRLHFKDFRLTEVAGTAATILGSLPTKEYRASVDFDINGIITTYILYSNPVFVSAPPCVGTHLIHRRQANRYLSADNVIKAADLKEAYPEADKLVIIDAQGAGEEVVARAWCAERARHAVIRRGPGCCFSCAVVVATRRTGLGVNVLIWSN